MRAFTPTHVRVQVMGTEFGRPNPNMDFGKDSYEIITHSAPVRCYGLIFSRYGAPSIRLLWARSSDGEPNRPETHRAMKALCVRIYRFVHTPGRSANSPEMLGAARPGSEGFSVRPLWT